MTKNRFMLVQMYITVAVAACQQSKAAVVLGRKLAKELGYPEPEAGMTFEQATALAIKEMDTAADLVLLSMEPELGGAQK